MGLNVESEHISFLTDVKLSTELLRGSVTSTPVSKVVYRPVPLKIKNVTIVPKQPTCYIVSLVFVRTKQSFVAPSQLVGSSPFSIFPTEKAVAPLITFLLVVPFQVWSTENTTQRTTSIRMKHTSLTTSLREVQFEGLQPK